MSASEPVPSHSPKYEENKGRTCYVSAAPQINLQALIELLEEQDLKPVLTSALYPTATTLLEENIKAISHTDLFIALLSSTEENAHVYFELGIAIASSVRTLLITPMDIHLPPNIAQVPLICTSPENKGAIEFAIEQVFSAPVPTQFRSDLSSRPKLQPIGDFSSQLLKRLDALGDKVKETEIIDLVMLALREGGISIIAQSPTPMAEQSQMVEHPQDVRADLAIWSDDFNSWIGNPLLIEVKVFRQKQWQIDEFVEQVLAYLGPGNARSALILYVGDLSSQTLPPRMYPNIYYMDVRELFTKLRTKSFAQILIDMRNRRVHGVEV
jgi:hypothetical protein